MLKKSQTICPICFTTNRRCRDKANHFKDFTYLELYTQVLTPDGRQGELVFIGKVNMYNGYSKAIIRLEEEDLALANIASLKIAGPQTKPGSPIKSNARQFKADDFYPGLEDEFYTGSDLEQITICKRCKCITDYCRVPAFHKSWAHLTVHRFVTPCHDPHKKGCRGSIFRIGQYDKTIRSHAGLIQYVKDDLISFAAVANLAALKYPQEPG